MGMMREMEDVDRRGISKLPPGAGGHLCPEEGRRGGFLHSFKQVNKRDRDRSRRGAVVGAE